MGKIGIIIWREYSTRVRNKTFIIMSILGPILVAGFFTLMAWMNNADKTEEKIMIIDETSAITISKLPDNEFIKFYYPKIDIATAKKMLYTSDFTAVVYIDFAPDKNPRPFFYCKKSPSFSTENYIKTQLEKKFFEWRLSANNIDPVVLHNSKVAINLITRKVNENGSEVETRNEYAIVFGFACAVLIFFFVIFYGMQVMRSVMEEKTNRIIEVIVSSVKPFQLMLGKIIGVAMVGITQFIIWIILSIVLTTASSSFLFKKIVQDTNTTQEQNEVVYKQGSNAKFEDFEKTDTKMDAMEMLKTVKSLDIPGILLTFFFYFLGGYLLYSALFAAIGSAVDSDADTQQFMLPIMLPLIAGYFMTLGIVRNPESDIAFWGSMIPFTSPIVMMARLPFGVPAWQIWLSLTLLVAGFLFTTWLAGKIYRTGILMYGKKVSWKELGKWIRYKG